MKAVIVGVAISAALISCTKEQVEAAQGSGNGTIASCEYLVSGKTSSTCDYPDPSTPSVYPQWPNVSGFTSTHDWKKSAYTDYNTGLDTLWQLTYFDNGTEYPYPYCESVCFEIEISKTSNASFFKHKWYILYTARWLEIPYSYITSQLDNMNSLGTNGLMLPGWNPDLATDLDSSDFILDPTIQPITIGPNETYQYSLYNQIFQKKQKGNTNPTQYAESTRFYKDFISIYDLNIKHEWCVWRFGFMDNSNVYHTGNIIIKITQ